MLYREIIAVCSETHAKHINVLRGKIQSFLMVEYVVHIVTVGLQRLILSCVHTKKDGLNSLFIRNISVHFQLLPRIRCKIELPNMYNVKHNVKHINTKNKFNQTLLTNCFSTNKGAFLLLCISFVVSCYMFRLNCHHEGADSYIAKTDIDEIVLQFL